MSVLFNDFYGEGMVLGKRNDKFFLGLDVIFMY